MPNLRHRPSRRQRRTHGVPLTSGLLRTERYELHALNLTAEGWDTWLRDSHALPLAWRSRCGLSGHATALIAGLVWASQPGRYLIEAHCDALSSRAETLAARPRLKARTHPTLANGTWYAGERGGTPSGAPQLLVVDPLMSGGVDQLSAIPTHAKRLAQAAAQQHGGEVAILAATELALTSRGALAPVHGGWHSGLQSRAWPAPVPQSSSTALEPR